MLETGGPRGATHLTGCRVSAPTLRRHAQTYEELFGPLPRERDQRRWPLDAVQHMQVAYQALAAQQVASIGLALALVRDGQALPEFAEIPDFPMPAFAAHLLDELRHLRALFEEQRLELASLRQEVYTLRTLPAPAELHWSLWGVPEQLENHAAQEACWDTRSSWLWPSRPTGTCWSASWFSIRASTSA